jgi:hypothetical protein
LGYYRSVAGDDATHKKYQRLVVANHGAENNGGP